MRVVLSIVVLCTTQSVISFPRRNARLDSTGNDVPPNEPDSYTPSNGKKPPSGPYPPSGWAPQGDLLLVPGETHSSQPNKYGPPPGNSGVTTAKPTITTSTEGNQEPEGSDINGQLVNLKEDNGQYFVLLPNGSIQKVQYSGRQRRGRQYEAQVQYEELDPVKAPIYSYHIGYNFRK